MNGIKYLADTNCFIYLLEENPIVFPFSVFGWAYSYITEIELLSKRDISPLLDAFIREMLESCYKVNQSQELTELVITLKRNNKIKLPDAIIAASAELMNMPLLTADKGFSNIEGINCFILDFK